MMILPSFRSLLVQAVIAVIGATVAAPSAVSAASDGASPPTSPATFQVGTRITWQGGESSTAGAQFVPDPNGWIWRNGQWYRVDSTGGNGGVGLLQLTLLSVAPDAVVGDMRYFLNTDLQTNTHVPSGYGVVTGTAEEIPGHWISPARLATVQEGFDGTTRVWRGQRTFLGQTFDTVSTATITEGNYVSNTYDVASGLLLFGGAVVAAPGVLVTDQSGNLLDSADGSVRYQHSILVGVRQVPVPWAGAPLPSWVTAGASLTYQGESSASTATTSALPPVPGQAITVTEHVDQVVGAVVVGREVVQASTGTGLPPSEVTTPRVFGSALFDGLWIPPDRLGELQPGQVLDQDPATNRTVAYAGSDGSTASIISGGPTDRVELRYDLRSGVLVSIRSDVSSAVGVQTTALALTSPPPSM